MGERLTWVGHSTVVVELAGTRVMTDPLLRARLAHLRRHAAPPPAGVTSGLDAVLLSHMHHDHLDAPSLRRIDRGVPVIAPCGAARIVRRLGFHSVTELAPGESTEVGGMRVTAVSAVHDGRRHPLSPPAEALGYVLAGEHEVYFAGDTDVFDDMAGLAGRLDVALLPIWGWGPSIGEGHMDPDGAARAAALLRPRVAVPIHWGTFFPVALARVRGSALREPPRAFAAQAARLAPDVAVRVLAPSETLEL